MHTKTLLTLSLLFTAMAATAELWLKDEVDPMGTGGYGHNSSIYNQGKAALGLSTTWTSGESTGVFLTMTAMRDGLGATASSGGLNYLNVPAPLIASPTSGTYALYHTATSLTSEYMRHVCRTLTLLPAQTNVYFSALMAYESTTAFTGIPNNFWAGVGLSSDNNTSKLRYSEPNGFFVGFQKINSSGTTIVRLIAGGGTTLYTAPLVLLDAVEPQRTYMVVVKVEYNADGAETLHFAVNPVPGAEAYTHSFSTELLSADKSFRYLKLSGCYATSSKAICFDQFLAGSTYEDVVGEASAATTFIGHAAVTARDNADFWISYQLATLKANSTLSLLLGTEPDVWTTTNSLSDTTLLQPISVPVPALPADTTYYYNIVAQDAPDELIYSGASPATFLNGELTISTPTAHGSEIDLTPATITVSRASSAVQAPLLVRYTLIDETAEAGKDYAPSHAAGAITIPAGADHADILIQPIVNNKKRFDTTLRVVLTPGAYLLNDNTNCVVTLQDKPPQAGYSIWIGTGDASIAVNWYPPHVPGPADHVLLADYSNGTLLIPSSSPLTVASWTQTADYTGEVTINAPFAGTTPHLTILGDCTIAATSGLWSHTQSKTSEDYKLHAEIKGNMTLTGNATLSVYARGYGSSNFGPGATPASGAAHAGENSDYETVAGQTYGSIFKPLRYGSAGSSSMTAGGCIQLTVGGTLHLDANTAIKADGNLRSSGGSILITAGKLTGTGTISSDAAGEGLVTNTGVGSGGRVAIHLTHPDSAPSDFRGKWHAHGAAGSKSGNLPAGGGGTLYWQTAGQAHGEGTIYIKDDFNISHGPSYGRRSTILPPELDCTDDYRQSNCIIQENGNLKLRANVRINSLWINTQVSNAESIPTLRLNGRRLSTAALKIGSQTYPPGIYTAAQLGPHVVDNPEALGTVEITTPGITLFVH